MSGAGSKRLLEHFRIQDEINKLLNGKNWKETLSYDYFYSCVVYETSKLLDAMGFKCWIIQKPDWENVKIEAVNMWHSIISCYLLVELYQIDLKTLLKNLEEGFEFEWRIRDENVIEALVRSILQNLASENLFFAFHFFGRFIKAVGFKSLEEFDNLYRKNTKKYEKLMEDIRSLIEFIESGY